MTWDPIRLDNAKSEPAFDLSGPNQTKEAAHVSST